MNLKAKGICRYATLSLCLVALMLILCSCGGSSKTTSITNNTDNFLSQNFAEANNNNSIENYPDSLASPASLAIPLDEILGPYDFGTTPKTLTAWTEILGIEIDPSGNKTRYEYVASNGEILSETLEAGENIQDFKDVAFGDGYHIDQYGYDGALLASVMYDFGEQLNRVKYIRLYERTTSGNLAAYFDFYPDYETEYMLHDYTHYHDGHIISKTTLDPDTYNRNSAYIYGSENSVLPIREYYCNYDGDFTSYTAYEYDDRNLTVSATYDLDDILTGYSIREYDSAGNCTKISFYAPDGTLTSCVEHTYDENGKQIDSIVTEVETPTDEN